MIDKKIKKLQGEIDGILEDEVLRLSRVALKENKDLEYFLIAMGAHYFVDKSKSIIDTVVSSKELYDFILKYDYDYGISGIGFCIYSNKIITDW